MHNQLPFITTERPRRLFEHHTGVHDHRAQFHLAIDEAQRTTLRNMEVLVKEMPYLFEN